MPKAVRSGAARAQSWESAIVENNHYLPRETHDRVRVWARSRCDGIAVCRDPETRLMTLAARPIYISIAFAVLLMTIGLLVAGKDLLIPLAVSIMIWYILNALAKAFDRIHFGMLHLPGWLRMTFAIISVLIVIALLVELISNNIADVQQAAPGYQANLEKLIDRGASAFGFEQAPSVAQVVEQIDFGKAMRETCTSHCRVCRQRRDYSGLRHVFVDRATELRQKDARAISGPRSRDAGAAIAPAHAGGNSDLYLDQDSHEPDYGRDQLHRADFVWRRSCGVLGLHHISVELYPHDWLTDGDHFPRPSDACSVWRCRPVRFGRGFARCHSVLDRQRARTAPDGKFPYISAPWLSSCHSRCGDQFGASRGCSYACRSR